MRILVKPSTKPHNPNFSSGPCAKPPGYQLSKIDTSTLGRSHRSATAKLTLERVCTETADILKLPDNYRVAIVPASDTGAMEMIMWSVLGERPSRRIFLGILRQWLACRYHPTITLKQRKQLYC